MDILEKLEELRDLNTRHANGMWHIITKATVNAYQMFMAHQSVVRAMPSLAVKSAL